MYADVLASPHGLSVDTFHSWFIRLLQIAPLAAGIPHGLTLEESVTEIREAAWLRFFKSLGQPENAHLRDALMTVYAIAGDGGGKDLLNEFLDQRAEWEILCEHDDPQQQLITLCGEDGERDARLSFWSDQQAVSLATRVARILGAGTEKQQTHANEIIQTLSADPSLESFERLCTACLTKSGEPRAITITKAQRAALAETDLDRFPSDWDSLCEALVNLRAPPAVPW